MSCY
jgi:quercetin dioxygenase-like cupin family protein